MDMTFAVLMIASVYLAGRMAEQRGRRFVGFAGETAAQEAIDQFSQTYFDTSKIIVSLARHLFQTQRFR